MMIREGKRWVIEYKTGPDDKSVESFLAPKKLGVYAFGLLKNALLLPDIDAVADFIHPDFGSMLSDIASKCKAKEVDVIITLDK